MKRLKIIKFWPVLFLIIVGSVFFYKTIIFGLMPVPSDSMTGMYHPFRDKFFTENPNGIPFKNFLITDPIRQQIPWRREVIDKLKSGKFPSGSIYNFSGMDLSGNIQSGSFYPLNIIFLILPFEISWSILILIQPIIAMLGMFWFLKTLKLGNIASVYGSIVFGFSGFSITWLTWGTMLQTLLWLPFILAVIESICIRKSVQNKANIFITTIALSAFLYLSFTAGHLQIFLYVFVFSVIYSLFRYGQILKKSDNLMIIKLKLIISGYIVFFITALPLIIRISASFRYSSRFSGANDYLGEGFFIPLKHFIQFIIPDFFGNPATLNYWGVWNYGELTGYVGISALIFAFYSFFRIKKTIFNIFYNAMIIGILIALESPLSKVPYIFNIPIINTLQPTRVLGIIDFCLAVLAAQGLTAIWEKPDRKTIYTIVGIIGIIFMLVFVFTGIPYIYSAFQIQNIQVGIIKRNIILPFIIFTLTTIIVGIRIISKNRINRSGFDFLRIFIIAITIFDLFRFGWKFTPFTGMKYFYPDTEIINYLKKNTVGPVRITSMDDKILPSNINAYYNIESAGGYDPLLSSRYQEFAAAVERGIPDIKPPFGFNRIINFKNIKSPLFPVLGINYVLSAENIDLPGFHQIITEGETKLYYCDRSFPRVYLAEKVSVFFKPNEIIEEMYRISKENINYAVIEYPENIKSGPLDFEEIAGIISYDNDEMIIEASTKAPRVLVILESYESPARYYINGEKIEPFRVNYVYSGIKVPAGSHRIIRKI